MMTRSTKTLTPAGYTTLAVLAYIKRFKAAHNGIAPTMREITDDLKFGSTSVAAHHMVRLERLGLIRRKPGVSRWIEVIETEEVTA